MSLPWCWPRSRLPLVGFYSLTLSACGDEKQERLPPASDRCGDKVCSQPSVSGGIAQSNSDSDPDVGSDAGRPAGDAGQLSGSVVIVQSPDLNVIRNLNETSVRIVFPAVRGGEETLALDGDQDFEIDVTPPVWLRVEPVETEDLITTIQGISRSGSGVRLRVLEREMMNEVSQSLAINPAALDPERGHALLHFVDSAQAPLANVSIEVTGGIVAYDVGASYSDSVSETSDRGAVALFNAPAASVPGRPVDLQVTYAGTTNSVSVILARNAFTLAIFELEEP
jgi:hypothetical protein